jgi:general L-amino acid transport system permease protein
MSQRSFVRIIFTWGFSGLIVLACIPLAWSLFRWGSVDSVWKAEANLCKEATGACWGVVSEKYRVLLWGRYPYNEQWRPMLSTLCILGLVLVSAVPRFQRAYLVVVWGLVMCLVMTLMGGGYFGLQPVSSSQWGGLPLTLLLTSLGLSIAFPFGGLLALGRMSQFPVVRLLATMYVECIRGVPLVAVLFVASFVLPLMMPSTLGADKFSRVLIGIAMFSAAYLAEVIRGGLRSVPNTQITSGFALGLSYWQVQRYIVWPQAFRNVLPALMNNFISTLKDSSLVTIVGMYELTGALSLALGGDPVWRAFYFEAYVFVGAIYWLLCAGLSQYSRYIEKRLH